MASTAGRRPLGPLGEALDDGHHAAVDPPTGTGNAAAPCSPVVDASALTGPTSARSTVHTGSREDHRPLGQPGVAGDRPAGDERLEPGRSSRCQTVRAP